MDNIILNFLEDVVNSEEHTLVGVLMVLTYPSKLPVDDHMNLGPTESLFAHRYEIGCASSTLFTTCFMEKSRNGGHLYELGVPCSKCRTHCEFFTHVDGTMEEGVLCVPPQETPTVVVKAETSLIPNHTLLTVFLLVALFGLIQYGADT
uniref:Uncharacterized protein n=1 Tax=Caenorhabditis japonica TaxID=281687 RepID=A0A8R1DJU1_CAEJA